MVEMPILIVLAGGASSRMAPLQEKSLLKFGSDSLLISQLRAYQSLGFHDVIVVANPQNATQMRDQLDTLRSEMHIQLAIQQEPRGMGDALLAAAALIGEPDRAVYVNQVHDVVDERLHVDLLAQWRGEPDSSHLAGVQMTEYFPGGYLIVGEDRRITGIVEKPGAGNQPSDLVNIVAHIHQHAGRLFDAIREEYRSNKPGDDHYERAMDALMGEHIFRVVPYQGRWRALKYPWHVLDIMQHFLERIEGQTVMESAFVAPTATLVGDVFIAEGARVFPGAAVVGPAYIGRDTIVGNNALVRQSMVLEMCNVGFTTEIARSYVAAGCQMHACRVLDSIFAENVNFSAGCTTANLRIDHGLISGTIKGERLNTGRDKLGAIIGANAFLGVDVMTMPGVKVGEGAEVGPGVHVLADVAPHTRTYVKQELIVIEKPQ